MVDEVRSLPLGSLDEFTSDRRNIGAAESCLRRALQALLDLGRRVLAPGSAHQLRLLAGYRNRMVHFYQNVTEEELYTICTREIADVLAVRDAFVSWLRNNPECIDNFMP
jgi:uncharacterized protein YutE (UPF0331/DUF86 family)